MSRRRLALASIAVVTVLAVVGVSVLAVAAGGSALAYEVNGSRVSQTDFDSLLHEIADTKGVTSATQPEGSLGSGVTATVLNVSILRAILRDVSADRNVKVTDADRQAGESTAKSQISNFDQAPAGYRKLVTDLFAYANALGLSDANALNTFLTKQALKADVYVNPRYGSWHPRAGGVCPPTGCASATQSSGSSG